MAGVYKSTDRYLTWPSAVRGATLHFGEKKSDPEFYCGLPTLLLVVVDSTL